MPNSKKTLIQVSAALLAIATTSQAIAASLRPETLIAQAANPTSFPLPSAVPSGTTVKVDGSPTMTVINQALKQGFEQQFSGTQVNLASSSTDEALKSLLDGKIDLAAIGRPLSAEEKAEGLKETPISREKVAIIVSPDNSFNGDLTFEQFAKIFRGEITDWSEVGGAPGAIRFIDRPASSDTRLSLSRYKVFQGAPFQTGSTAVPAAQDDTATVISDLGKDGIGYAIVSQVLNQSNVKIVPMHRTLPDNPAYPYSQPRSYVYKGEASPAIAAFLGFAGSAPGQAALQDAKLSKAAAATGLAASPTTDSTASASPTTSPEAAVGAAAGAAAGAAPDAASVSPIASPSASASDTALVPGADAATDRTGLPGWLGWLLLPLIAGGIWWLTRRGSSAPAAVPPAAVPPTYVPPAAVPPVPVPPVGAGALATGAAIAGATALGVGAVARPAADSRIILTPRDSQNAYAYWETPDAHKADVRDQGGRDLKLRVTDVTDADGIGIGDISRDTQTPLPSSTREFDLAETDRDLHVPIPQADRDYIAQIGYKTPSGDWLELAQSNLVRVSSAAAAMAPTVAEPNVGEPNANGLNMAGLGLAAGGAALAAGATAAVAAAASERLLDRSTVVDDSRLLLAARTPESAYAYWETPAASKTALQTQDGQQFQLRLYDTTNLDLDEQPAHSVQTFDLSDRDQDLHVPIPQSDRDYTAEIGYETSDGRWLKLARSNELRIAAEPNNLTMGTGMAAIGGITAIGAAGAATLFPSPQSPQDSTTIQPSTVIQTPTVIQSPATIQPSTPIETPTVIQAPNAIGDKTLGDRAPVPALERCSVKTLTVNSRRNCFLLEPEQTQQLQSTAVSKTLEPGRYLIRLKEGGFGNLAMAQGEPIVLLWLYGGTVVNQKTNIPVPSTWSTLNGYNETLSLVVLESATLSAFFIDTHLEDNQGEVVLSVVKL